MSIQPGSSKLAGRHSVPEIQKKQKSQIKKILLQLLNYQGALSVGYHRQYSFYRRRLFTAYLISVSSVFSSLISTGLSLSCGTWSCHAVSLFTNSVFTVSSGLVFLSVFVLSISPIILPITKAVKKHRHPLTYTSILPIFFSLCQSHKIFLSISIVFFSLISFKSAIAFSSYSCLIHCHSIFYRGPVSSLHHLCIISASFLHYAAVLISIPYMLLSVFPVSCNNPC